MLTPDVAGANRFVEERLAGLPDVTAVECLFATSLYTEGSRWRLGSLASAQLSAHAFHAGAELIARLPLVGFLLARRWYRTSWMSSSWEVTGCGVVCACRNP